MLDFFRNFFGVKKGISHGSNSATSRAGQWLRGGLTASETKPRAAAACPPGPTPRIFLSYSRVDAAFATELRQLIEGRGLSLWQDISHLEAGRWWDQIEKILSAPTTEHLVLVVSSDALASRVVRDEWRLARSKGVQVSPVARRDGSATRTSPGCRAG